MIILYVTVLLFLLMIFVFTLFFVSALVGNVEREHVVVKGQPTKEIAYGKKMLMVIAKNFIPKPGESE